MRRLILHIGSHKTGSTSLQNALRRGHNEGVLGSWTYVFPPGKSAIHGMVIATGSGPDTRFRVNIPRLLELMPQHGDCIISSELLFWLDEAAQIDELARVLRARFDDIHLVAYLRRQDALALSHRKQVVRGVVALQFYGAKVSALPEFQPHMMRYFDYPSKLDMWARAFGQDRITVRRFQASDLVGGDTVHDFFGLIGVPPVIIRARANEAMSRSQILAGLWLQARGLDAVSVWPELMQIDDPDHLMPSRSDAQAFLYRFGAINAELARRYDPSGPARYFDEDMSGYPVEGNDCLDGLEVDLADLEALAIRRRSEQREDGGNIE